MNILVIGSGGREHALVWKLKQSSGVRRVFCAPGNAGIARDAECVPLKSGDFAGIAAFVREHGIELTVVGPEAPLADGIVDFFQREKLPIFGPNRAAARLEASKVFAKDFMQRHDVPTASYRSFTDPGEASRYLDEWPADKPLVVKADGLAAGKGVIICRTPDEARKPLREILEEKVFGAAGSEIVIEEFLEGEEASLQIFLDGAHYAPMVAAQDHKRVFDDDQGPNTGGMGAYAPAPIVDRDLLTLTEKTIIAPIIRGLRKEGIDYRGVLYIGLMICGGKPSVLEFNCRFGDPETQVVLPLLKTDLVEIMQSIIAGRLDKLAVEWYNRSAVCVVLASGGYPGACETGKMITGLDAVAAMEDVTVFHAGTGSKGSTIVTSGGRVLGVTGLGVSLPEAIQRVYAAVKKIDFEAMHYRRDIGRKALKRLKLSGE